MHCLEISIQQQLLVDQEPSMPEDHLLPTLSLPMFRLGQELSSTAQPWSGWCCKIKMDLDWVQDHIGKELQCTTN